MPALPALIDLSTLGTLGFIVQGDNAFEEAGFAVSSAGDVNGDGFDDFLLSSPYANAGGDDKGNVYLIFGKGGGFADIDLSTLSPADGFTIQGAANFDRIGQSLASADVNGDGYSDIVIGVRLADDGSELNTGKTYVIFGKAGGFADIDLAALALADGFTITGDAQSDASGDSVSSAGDVNGDGYDDLIIGATSSDDGDTNSGDAYLIFGKAGGFADINLGALALADGFEILGAAAGDQTGISVSSAGDINNDGFDELIIGANVVNGATGAAYVLFGKSGGFADIDLAALAPADGFTISGDQPFDNTGYRVSDAGDINNDGYDDLLVGAIFGDDGGTNAGETYVIYGKSGGFTDIALGSLAPADGFIIQGAENYDVAGRVSSAGDVNGDGYDDILIGAPGADTGGSSSGNVYLIYGKAGGFTNIDLAALDPADGFVIQGDAANDYAGNSISAAGDINGDGFDDLIVGLNRSDVGGTNIGNTYVIFGSAAGPVPFPFDFDLDTDISPTSGATIIGGYAGDAVGVSVSSAGDINGDGFDDVIIGAPTGNYGYGAAFVVFGSATGIPDTDLATLIGTNGFAIYGGDPLTLTGLSVSSAGDVNGDGYDDIIVGAPYADFGDGEAHVIFGKAGGFTDINLDALAPEDGFTIRGGYEGGAGWDVSSGDVNGDGFSDLIIGAPYYYDSYDYDYSGRAYVIFGKDGDPVDFDDIDLTTLDPADGFSIRGAGDYDRTGLSVASADVNGDGFDDILVGAPGACGCFGPGEYYGKVWVVFGKANGLTDIELGSLDPADGFVISGVEEYDFTGYSVASAGDINGDGFDEIVIGTPFSYDGGDYLGSAYVIFGKADGFTDIDLAALDPADGFVIHGVAPDDYAGITVSGAGDVNGDGLADIIIGAPMAGDYDNGASYVIFGKDGGFTDIDLANLTAADGFVIHGAEDYDQAGSVSSAGDVDGDGFDDLIIGAPGAYGYGPYSGTAYIIYGRGLSARDDEVAVDEDATVSGDIFADNGSGTDRASRGVVLELAEVNGSAANIDTEIILASGAKLTVNADGTFDYDPNGVFDYLITAATAAATGAVNTWATDTFTYTITGGETATVTITINGVESADDELWGDSFANTITGTSDPDIFRLSQGGEDIAQGGAGDDSFIFADTFGAADQANGGTNDANGDTVILEGDYSGAPLVLGPTSIVNVERLRLIGGFSYDITSDDAMVAAGEGFIVNASALGSSEVLTFDGSAETDGRLLLIGGDGSDNLTGGGSDDTLIGGDGDNMLDGGGGIDLVDYSFTLGRVDVDLGSGIANLNGFGGFDLLTSIENVFGSAFNDTLVGSNVANVLAGGGGTDDMTGGDGDDVYVVEQATDSVTELAGEGFDTVRSAISYTLGADLERLVLIGTAANGIGNGGANILIGNGAANQLDGAGGADTMRGFEGDDTYYVDDALDQVFEVDPGHGFDTVRSSVSFALGSYQERLILTGAANIDGLGNTLDNVLLGNGGNNLLNGGQGADQMRGGGGDDTYVVDNAGDTVVEISAADGTDLIRSSVTFVLGSHQENLVLTGFAAIDGTGNTLVNSLTGNGGNNQLNGGQGADTMTGGAGDDTYTVDNIGDVVVETAGNGTDLVKSGVDYVLSAAIENLTLTGSAANGTGNNSANILTGNNAANDLSGGGSADTLFGGFGTDTLDGGIGNDKLYGGASSDDLIGGAGFDGFYFDAPLNAAVNVDDILDFVAADDTIFLDRDIFTGLAADGAIGAAAFRLGTSALDADDRILYDAATGQIRYDADGAGGAAAILFATVTPGTALTSADFVGY